MSHKRLSEERLQRYLHRSDSEIREDLVAAFDQIERLRDRVWSANIKVWILSGVVLSESATIAWLADKLFMCIDQAHQVARVLH